MPAGSWRYQAAPHGVLALTPDYRKGDARARYLRRFGDQAVTAEPSRRRRSSSEQVVLAFVLQTPVRVADVIQALLPYVDNADDLEDLVPDRQIYLIPIDGFAAVLPLLKRIGKIRCVRGSFPGVAKA